MTAVWCRAAASADDEEEDEEQGADDAEVESTDDLG